MIPKLYNGRNQTFFFLGYRLDYDHETNLRYRFRARPGGTQRQLLISAAWAVPIYDPKTITCTNPNGCASGTGYTATAFPGNVIPVSRIDPVAAKFLSLKPYNLPNLAGTYTNTGPDNNFISGNKYISDRQGLSG